MYLLIIVVSDVMEDVFYCSWNDPSLIVFQIVSHSFHSIGLSCSCLPVGHDGAVVPFQSWLYGEPGCVHVNLLLAGLIIVNLVKYKIMPTKIVGILHVSLEINSRETGIKVFIIVKFK